ncbi:MAG: flagellar motor protein MotB [Myxococcota bacterium]
MSGEKVRIIVKKKKGGGHGHHGGAWKVAYADFVTAMMALFMVLWLLTQADLKTRSAIAQYFQNPGFLAGGNGVTTTVDKNTLIAPVTPKMMEQAKASEQRILEHQAGEVNSLMRRLGEESPELKEITKSVQVKVTERGLQIELVDTGGELLFDKSSASLKRSTVRVLEALAPALAGVPNDLEVGGHTDGQPFSAGSGRSNWDLSFERADAARQVLTKSGLRPGQLKRVQAHADSELLNPDDPLDPKNRRLSILVVRRGLPPGPETDAPEEKGARKPGH